MPALKVTGTNRLLNKLRKDQEFLRGQVQRTHQNIVRAMFTDLVAKSPQWSGKLAGAWYITYKGVGSGPKQYRSRKWGKGSWGPMPGPYKMGDDPTVSLTLGRELPKISGIKWNTTVTFVNTATYAQEVLEQGRGPTYGGQYHPLRSVNVLTGKVATVNYVRLKYGRKQTLQRYKV